MMRRYKQTNRLAQKQNGKKNGGAFASRGKRGFALVTVLGIVFIISVALTAMWQQSIAEVSYFNRQYDQARSYFNTWTGSEFMRFAATQVGAFSMQRVLNDGGSSTENLAAIDTTGTEVVIGNFEAIVENNPEDIRPLIDTDGRVIVKVRGAYETAMNDMEMVLEDQNVARNALPDIGVYSAAGLTVQNANFSVAHKDGTPANVFVGGNFNLSTEHMSVESIYMRNETSLDQLTGGRDAHFSDGASVYADTEDRDDKQSSVAQKESDQTWSTAPKGVPEGIHVELHPVDFADPDLETYVNLSDYFLCQSGCYKDVRTGEEHYLNGGQMFKGWKYVAASETTEAYWVLETSAHVTGLKFAIEGKAVIATDVGTQTTPGMAGLVATGDVVVLDSISIVHIGSPLSGGYGQAISILVDGTIHTPRGVLLKVNGTVMTRYAQLASDLTVEAGKFIMYGTDRSLTSNLISLTDRRQDAGNVIAGDINVTDAPTPFRYKPETETSVTNTIEVPFIHQTR